MIQDLGKRMEAKIKKMQEMFNKDLEELKNKQMERYTMFLDWKNQHCENDSTTQNNLQIQYNPYQTTLAFFTELEQKTAQFVWKHKRP